ncbi:MAG: amidohydrolase family protein [Nitrospirae bacterium]|nr:amidohydrolase family protein [Nitrospirota bacterium]
MSGIIDFHTHAFPDKLAEKAIPVLEKEGDCKANLDGKISSLLSAMDRCSIEKSVICSIATKPSQFDSILSWSKEIASDRIIPFLSLHPADPQWEEHIEAIKLEGFKGIKMHPYYQEFDLDERRLFPIYEKIADEGLILLSHTGFDIAFPKDRKADPAKIINVLEAVPSLKLVASHLGAWDDWAEVERHMSGREVYMEISFSLELLNNADARRIITSHPEGYILFGSDSPWTEQCAAIKRLQGLGLGESLEKRILRDNALSLLG